MYYLFFTFHLWEWMVKKLRVKSFYATGGKKDWAQGQWQKKLLMEKPLELSTNVWLNTSSGISKKVTLTPKPNKGQRDLLLWKMWPCMKWLNNSQAQALSTDLSSSQNTIKQHLYQLDLVNRLWNTWNIT